MESFPRSDHAALADFVESVRKRSRALGHKFSVRECGRVVETDEGTARERIELSLGGAARNALRLRFWIWQDRWCWFDARIGAKTGWTFEWSVEGRLAGGLTGKDLLMAIERSYEVIAVSQDDAELETLWRPLLLRGPEGSRV
jgi:hypothetical protein